MKPTFKLFLGVIGAFVLIGVIKFGQTSPLYSIGEIINSIFPCEQNPADTEPCYRAYEEVLIRYLYFAAGVQAVFFIFKLIRKK